jgi:uncharacterized membrane protein
MQTAHAMQTGTVDAAAIGDLAARRARLGYACAPLFVLVALAAIVSAPATWAAGAATVAVLVFVFRRSRSSRA